MRRSGVYPSLTLLLKNRELCRRCHISAAQEGPPLVAVSREDLYRHSIRAVDRTAEGPHPCLFAVKGDQLVFHDTAALVGRIGEHVHGDHLADPLVPRYRRLHRPFPHRYPRLGTGG